MEVTAKSISDKADMGYVMTRVSEKMWEEILPALRTGVRSGLIDAKYINDTSYRPTHVIDIYKMRRGRYKNVRIWTNIHLGTGYRKDLFITNADNQPLMEPLTLYKTSEEVEIDKWKDSV